MTHEHTDSGKVEQYSVGTESAILKCGERDRNFAEIQFSLSSNADVKVEGEVAINFMGLRTSDLSIFEDLRKGEAG